MKLTAIVEAARGIYIAEFRAFVSRQKATSKPGAAEVKLQIDPDSRLFRRLYCCDFASNVEGSAAAVELTPARSVNFEKFEEHVGPLTIGVEDLRWHDVIIRHDAGAPPEATFDAWFNKWFDPADSRVDPDSEFSGVIHSLLVEPGSISVDFGTAPEEAFWELLSAAQGYGIRRLRISSSA